MERELPQYALSDLARAIYLLFGQLEFKEGTKNLLLAILEELIGSPAQSFKQIFAHQSHSRQSPALRSTASLPVCSRSSAMARGEHRSAPGAVRQQHLLHYISQQSH